MCGIFGLIAREGACLRRADFERTLRHLAILSESRGKESAGLHFYIPDLSQAWTVKDRYSMHRLLGSGACGAIMRSSLDMAYESGKGSVGKSVFAIGHSRLVTNGLAELPENNQPVRYGAVTVVHNGIVTNVNEIKKAMPQLSWRAEVDTEAIAALLAEAAGNALDPLRATRGVFAQIHGAASIAWLHDRTTSITLASNTGDLFCHWVENQGILLFASERHFLDTALASRRLRALAGEQRQIKPGTGRTFDLCKSGCNMDFDLAEDSPAQTVTLPINSTATRHQDTQASSFAATTPRPKSANANLLLYNESLLQGLRRCSKCILPETFPFIEYDGSGVCNYCLHYRPRYQAISSAEDAKQSFLKTIEPFRRANEADTLVPFSGGRDSCYGLHVIKNELGLHPITFTYDWGMVTDLARRNIARVCGQLGVQNILVSADIRRKRENIRRNVLAWLKKPSLGIVPLFMAGDKRFLTVSNALKKQNNLRLDLWSGNFYENTDFKSGFCGVTADSTKHRIDHLSFTQKIRLCSYYASRFLENPRYLNRSLPDTLLGFYSYYFAKRVNFFNLFHYMHWDEKTVNDTILSQYGFESATDTRSLWRIGDGVAPFYNYIYVTLCGFSEFDTFRSNQIREGVLSRESALKKVLEENRPRFESLNWYFNAIGLDFDSAVRRINEFQLKESAAL
ncbi:MAG: hypothetical protein ACYYK0_00070 [Candidatus Eutrophobiaceae bacterium]